MRMLVAVTLAITTFTGGLVVAGTSESGSAPTDDADEWPTDEYGYVDRGFSGIHHFEVNFPSPLGGTIHAEVYIPADLGPHEQVPVLLEITPYAPLEFRQYDGPEGSPDPQRTNLINEYVERGYGVAYVDARGYGGSSGCWNDHGDDEMADAVASVEWFAAQPWSTGEIGMVGLSYRGALQLLAAVGQAEGLVTIVPVSPVTTVYENHWDNGVAYRWNFVSSSAAWFAAVYPPHALVPPWNDIGSYPGYVQSIADSPQCQPTTTMELLNPDGRYTEYFAERDRQDDAHLVEASVFWAQGFWDANLIPHALLPMWTDVETPKRAWFWHGYHTYPAAEHSGRDGWFHQTHLWLDHWLYDAPNGIMDQPQVEVQDSLGRWRYEESWPPTDAETRRFLPTSEGILRQDGPASGQVSFTTDPYTSFGFETDERAVRVPEGAHFTTITEPFEEPLHIAGTARYNITVASDETRGHVVAALFDVSPDGTWTIVDRAAFNLRHREGLDQVVDVEPGEPMEITFGGLPTDWVFDQGHRMAAVYVGTEFRYYTTDVTHTLTLTLGEGTTIDLPVIEGRTEFFDQSMSSALLVRERMGPPEGFQEPAPHAMRALETTIETPS